MGSLSLLQGTFPTQGLNPGLPHCRRILYQLSHKGSPACIQFSSVQLLSCVQLFATPRTAAQQASLSITNSQSSPKPTSTESVMPSNHRILCRPLPLLSSVMQTARYKRSSETTLCIVQFSQSCPTVCDPMDYSTPGLPVHHQLPEFTQTHLH